MKNPYSIKELDALINACIDYEDIHNEPFFVGNIAGREGVETSPSGSLKRKMDWVVKLNKEILENLGFGTDNIEYYRLGHNARNIMNNGGFGKYLKKKEDAETLPPEPPAILKQIKWLMLYGKKHWKVIVIAVILLIAAPLYKYIDNHKENNKVENEEAASLGMFEFVFKNSSSTEFSIQNPAEFYISAPESPGHNVSVSSGLMQMELSSAYTLNVMPNKTVKVKGKILNEKRILQYIDAGEFFALIIFSASPKPIRTEIVFTREILSNGIKFTIQD